MDNCYDQNKYEKITWENSLRKLVFFKYKGYPKLLDFM